MFTIIGGDGKEYGPVNAEQVWTWLNSGRANLQTKARRAGGDQWRSLGEFAEFGAPPHLAEPPPLASSLPAVTASAPPVAMIERPAAPMAANDYRASRGQRFLAFLIDSLLGSLSFLPGAIILGVAVLRLAMNGQYGDVETVYNSMAAGRLILGLALFCFLPVIVFIVQIWLLAARGQTIGKKLLSIRIVKFPERTRVGIVHVWLLRAVVPGLIMLLPYFGFLFFLVDSCFIFGSDRRCLHDLIAGTQVIRTDREQTSAPMQSPGA